VEAAAAKLDVRPRDYAALTAAGVTVLLWGSAFVGIRSAGRSYSPGALSLGRLSVAVAGLAILGRSWVTGVPVTVHDGFELEQVGRAPSDDGVTIVSLVPTTLRRLLHAGSLGRFRAVVVGGAPLPEPLREEAAHTGVAVYDAYGLTETWGGCVTNGVPNDTVEARLLAHDEVALRGTPVMREYRNDGELTRDAFTAAG